MAIVHQIILLSLIISIVLCIYSYCLYPLLLFLIRIFVKRVVDKKDIKPNVSIIICARNEESTIAQKISNTQLLQYSEHLKEIIVVSDGSTDKTVDIASQFVGKNIKVIPINAHVGKESAQLVGFKEAKGDILVFTDVSTILQPDALLNFVSNFADPTVGCVSSTDVLINEKGESSEGLYIKYEMALRKLESDIGTLVGSSGSCFAVRRDIFAYFNETTMSSDFKVALLTAKAGMRTIMDTNITGTYTIQTNVYDEFNRKVRTITRGIYFFFKNVEFVNPFKYGILAFQLISHKLLRWTTPLFMVLTFILTLALINIYPFAKWLLSFQIVFYLIGVLACIYRPLRKNSIFRINYFLLMVHSAMLISWVNWISKKVQFTWEPFKREPNVQKTVDEFEAD